MRAIKYLGLAAIAGAALAASSPASAQLFLQEPNFPTGPISGSEALVGIPLPDATSDEFAAHLLWNLRAGLNVAALQCQFSPYLRVVDNYNGILAHHSTELMGAYSKVGAYFKRKHGAREGQRLFDDYSTITYNGFSTLQAQYGFCQVAADIAKEALARPKGMMHLTARNRLRELRSSLVPVHDAAGIVYNPRTIELPALPVLDEACYDKKNRLKKKCRTTVASSN
jgi:hypothetical protein